MLTAVVGQPLALDILAWISYSIRLMLPGASAGLTYVTC